MFRWARHALALSVLFLPLHGLALAAPRIVVNEIDYDQPGTDATEFIELKNVDTVPIDLSTVAVQLVNGSGGGAALYQTIFLPAVLLAPGAYYVICGNGACDRDITPDVNAVQNGAPDAVAIVLLADGSILDTVSYEGDTGAPYTEGSGTGLIDDGSQANIGISRFPDGADTGSNNVDWRTSCITPGGPNTSSSSTCARVSVMPLVWSVYKSLYR